MAGQQFAAIDAVLDGLQIAPGAPIGDDQSGDGVRDASTVLEARRSA
jgi:hypothetical protein